jgi:BirA family transcriptional regulator, biotin operon repressor / biotin---[acetyl-CoA-carboxylase] ligase
MYKILANTIFLGKDVFFLPECHSTNDKALELIRAGLLREGSIVITGNQTRGKGQRGNVWESEAGQNLTFSLVLEPKFMDISEQFQLNMMVSNSIRRLLQEYVPDLKVKWPNDLVVPGHGKIGGILIENILTSNAWESAVVGIGLNVNQRQFTNSAACSLATVSGSTFDLEELFRLLIANLEQGYILLKKGKQEELQRDYFQHLYLRDQWAVFKELEGEFEGKVLGVSKDGRLLMELRDGSSRSFELKQLTFPNP